MGIKSKLGSVKGFTIIELIVVIVVIGILVGITVLGYGAWKHSVAVAQVKSDLASAGSAMESARNFSGSTGYPSAIPSTITASSGVTLSFYAPAYSTTTYCIDATSTTDASVVFYMASENKDVGVLSGNCAGKPVPPNPPSTAPSSLLATAISSSQIDLSWGASTGAADYTIQRATDPAFVYVVGEATQSGLTRSSTGLSANTPYYYRVRANNAGGSSGWSSMATATTGLSAPTGLAVVAFSTSQLNYSWAALTGAVTYNIQRANDSGFSSGLTTVNTASTSGSSTSLSASTTYFYRVQAINNIGLASSYSSTVSSATYTNWGVYSKFASVGDWNGDGKNDIVAYKSDGTVNLHLGGGNGTFGPATTMTNIGTIVRNLLGPGILPSGTAPIIWWDNTDGTAYALKSNGSTGVTGSPIANSTGWNTVTSVFTAPKYYTNGTVTVIEKQVVLSIWSLPSNGIATFLNTYGSGWDAAYPGDNVFGTGDFNGDNIGDIAGISAVGAMTIYPGTGTGTTGTTFSGGSGWTSNIVFGGWDINNDNHPDILRYLTSTGVLEYYPGSGTSGGAFPYFNNGGSPIVIN